MNAGLPNAPLQHVRDSERLGDIGNGCLLSLEIERRCTRWNSQLWDLREHVDQFLRQPIGEILLVFLFAHVEKRQDGDRFLRDRGLSWSAGRRGKRSRSE